MAEIETAWINEKLSPELLPHKAELVEVLMEQVFKVKPRLILKLLKAKLDL